MKKKLTSTLAMLAVFYGLPLAAEPRLLVHPHILLLMTAAVLVWATQPAVSVGDAAKNQRSDRNSVWVILALSAMSVTAPVVEWAYFGTPPAGLPPWGGAFGIGLGLTAGGIALRIWAIRTLGAFFTATVQVSTEQRVVTSGPYSTIRHPSYLGAYLAFLGCAVSLQAWLGLSITLWAMGLAYYFRIDAEEKALVEAFGETYRAYQQRTWRMAPGLW